MGHGKGPHDGARACLKWALWKEQLKANGIPFQNITQVVSFIQSSMNLEHVYEHAQMDVKHNFIEVKVGEVNMTHGYDCWIVTNSKSFHYVRSITHSNNVFMETRELSCFCDTCVDYILEGDCDSKSHVAPWTLLTLPPYSASNALSLEVKHLFSTSFYN